MKIYLIYLAINDWQAARYNYGLGYIAAVLKKDGHSVRYKAINGMEDLPALCENIKLDCPGIIAFSSTTSQFSYIKEIAGSIRTIFDGLMICGGVHATLEPGCLSEIPELDGIVRGEGEYALLELARSLEKGQSRHSIKNFWFRVKGEIIKNDVRPLIEDIDALPFPDKESLDYQALIDRSDGVNRVIFSRGCPFSCTYCSNKALSEVYPNRERYFRQLSPQKAIEEIGLDSQRYNFKRLAFDDDAVNSNKEWFYEFFSLYKKEFYFPFECNLRVENMEPDMAALLKEAGAVELKLGVEHGNEDFRRRVLNRQLSNKKILDAVELCRRYGFAYQSFLMVGFPYETKKIFFDTVRLCGRIGGNFDVSIFTPYPGTELGRICKENGWLPQNRRYLERKVAVISYQDFSKKEIQFCKDKFNSLVIRSKFFPLDIIPLPILMLLYKFSDAIKKISAEIRTKGITS